MKRIKYFLLRKLAGRIIWYLHSGGFTVVNPNDAAIIFRADSVMHEAHFPWHLAPENIPEGEDVPMPGYLATALVAIFALQKPWIMEFLFYYLNNEAKVEGDLETYKQKIFSQAQAEQAARDAGQPETENDQVLH